MLDTGEPHPALIVLGKKGTIDHQDIWQGKPKTLVGFVRHTTFKYMDVDIETWFGNPYLAVGKYPVFTGIDGTSYVAHAIVKQIEIIEE